MTQITLFSVFLTGFLGSLHCIGMCGGIVGALTMGLPQRIRQSQVRLFTYLLTYNLGRISSYVFAGMLSSFLGTQLTQFLPEPHLVGRGVSGLFMIAVGLYLGAWWQGLAVLEKLGTHLWQRIEPLGRYFLPVNNLPHALGLGIVWGWLPCGLVYGALALSLTMTDTLQGGLLMLMFGMGTLVMTLVMGSTAHWLIQFSRKRFIRRGIGAFIMVCGLYTLLVLPTHLQNW